jgi:hypothetical protein
MSNTRSILARYRREEDTSSAAAHRENTATGEGETGVAVTGTAVIGAAIGGIIDSPVDLVTRTTGVGSLLGAGAFLTHTRYYSYYPYRYYPAYWYDYDYYNCSVSRRQFFGP